MTELVSTAPPTALGPGTALPIAEADDSSHLTGSAPRDKKAAHHARNVQIVAVSYVLDGLVLLLFWWAGTISWVPAVVYTTFGLCSSALLYRLITSGWTQRLRDPSIVTAHTVVAQTLQLVSMALFPEVSFMFALLLFIVYCSYTMSVPAHKSVVAWVIVSTACALVLLRADVPMQVPHASFAEQLIVYLFYVLTLWRCVFLGTFAGNMSRLLHKRGQDLAWLTAQVDQLAHYDELTGVMNRRSLIAALHDEIQISERNGQPLCIALMDLDHFKAVNDRLGHLAGDRTLKIFASTLSQLTRRADRFGRYGGEEFVLVMTGATTELARVPLQRMRQALQLADWSSVAPDFTMTFSCGVSGLRPGDSPETLLKRADDALYRAKRDGRDCTREA